MRAELTSTEIAMSGSYFDDVLRDPRRYGIENTTGKLHRVLSVTRTRCSCSAPRLNADTITDGGPNPLLAAAISFGL